MPSLASERFRIQNAKEFVKSFSENTEDSYYMFIGRTTPWPTGDTANDVPTPTDTASCTAFRYWDDMIALVKIQPVDVVSAIYRHDYTANQIYRMYDCDLELSQLFDETLHPFYIINSNDQIFKCLYNGRANSTNTTISLSTIEPDITSQADITALTIADGNPKNYTWKYLYTIPLTDKLRFQTENYIPIRSLEENLDTTGDILDDNSLNFDVFNDARLTNNGAIYQIVIEEEGLGYGAAAPEVEISGDGEGATAVAHISSGKLSDIVMTSYGRNYSYATVTLNPVGDSPIASGSARAILSPRNMFKNTSGSYYKTNHGIDLEYELGAKYVIISTRIEGPNTRLNPDGTPVTTATIIGENGYRRVGILKNPLLHSSNTVANDDIYSQTTDLTLASVTGTFNLNEIVYQAETNAYGVVVEVTPDNIMRLTNVTNEFSNAASASIVGIGNGNTTGIIWGGKTFAPIPEAFTSTVEASGATATVTEIKLPDISPYSGDLLYVSHQEPIVRDMDLTEIIRVVMTF